MKWHFWAIRWKSPIILDLSACTFHRLHIKVSTWKRRIFGSNKLFPYTKIHHHHHRLNKLIYLTKLLPWVTSVWRHRQHQESSSKSSMLSPKPVWLWRAVGKSPIIFWRAQFEEFWHCQGLCEHHCLSGAAVGTTLLSRGKQQHPRGSKPRISMDPASLLSSLHIICLLHVLNVHVRN